MTHCIGVLRQKVTVQFSDVDAIQDRRFVIRLSLVEFEFAALRVGELSRLVADPEEYFILRCGVYLIARFNFNHHQMVGMPVLIDALDQLDVYRHRGDC